MSWDAVHPAPSYYILQSNQNESGPNTYHQVYKGSNTSKTFTAPTVSETKRIHYRVEACSDYGCSDWVYAMVMVCVSPEQGCRPGGQGVTAPRSGDKEIGPHAGTARLALHYEYDEAGEVVQAYTTDITHPFWTATGADAAGHVTMAAESGNSLSVTRAYDRATGALTAAVLDGPSGLRQDAAYGYDQYGNLTSRADDLASRGETETYQYDSFDRLAIATADIPNIGTVTTASAHYSASGDLTSRDDAAGSFSYTYGVGNKPHRLTHIGGELASTLSYDAAGRVTAEGTITVAYNARGLATDLTRQGHESTIAYAPDGHEYRETIDGTKTLAFIAGGVFRVVHDSQSGVSTYRQALVVAGAVIGQVVSTSVDGTPRYQYFGTDNIGSVTEVVGGGGAELRAFAYDPFGRRRQAVNWKSILPLSTLQTLDAPTRRGYTGAEMLDETGFVVMGARVYSPELGRWLAPDPAGLGSPYVYVSNNPESDTDALKFR